MQLVLSIGAPSELGCHLQGRIGTQDDGRDGDNWRYDMLDPEIDRVELDDRSTAIGDQLDRSTQLLTLLSTQLDYRQRQSTLSAL